MPNLDIRTLALATAMILVVISLNLAYFRYTSDSLAGVGAWALGAFAGGVGLFLVGQRQVWPDWLTVVVANLLIGLFAAMLYLGLLRFLGLPFRIWRKALLVTALGVGLVVYTYVHPSVNSRIVIVSLFFIGFSLSCIRLLFRASPEQAPHNRLLLVSFAIMAVEHAARVVLALSARAEPVSFMSAGPFHAMVFLIDSGLHCLITIGLVFMCIRRMDQAVRQAHDELCHLGGLLPICSSCKRIRDDRGYWHQVEAYIKSHSEAEFTHGICPDCMQRLYPEAAANILGSPGGCEDLARSSLTPKP